MHLSLLRAQEDAILRKQNEAELVESELRPQDDHLTALYERCCMLEVATRKPEGLWSHDDEFSGRLLARLKAAQRKAFVLGGAESAVRSLVRNPTSCVPTLLRMASCARSPVIVSCLHALRRFFASSAPRL